MAELLYREALDSKMVWNKARRSSDCERMLGCMQNQFQMIATCFPSVQDVRASPLYTGAGTLAGPSPRQPTGVAMVDAWHNSVLLYCLLDVPIVC